MISLKRKDFKDFLSHFCLCRRGAGLKDLLPQKDSYQNELTGAKKKIREKAFFGQKVMVDGERGS
jgi:hypothetical protein